MGYYTKHELTIVSGDSNIDHKSEIEKISGYGESTFTDEIKWYKCDSQMKEYSINHPNTVLKITGEGEDYPDIWQAFYKNGKSYTDKAEIKFTPFNENNLK